MLHRFKQAFSPIKAEDLPLITYPDRVITLTGLVFRYTETDYQQHSSRLSQTLSFQKLISEAEIWLRASGSLLSYALLALLFSPLSLLQIFLIWLLVAGFWHTQKSAFYNPKWTKGMVFLASDGLWLLAALLSLSMLGMQQQFGQFGLGLGVLFFLRTGLFQRLVEWMYAKWDVHHLNDRMLQSVIIKNSILHGVPHPALQQMRQEWSNRYQKWQKMGERRPSNKNKANK
jgi:hypothetical protein